MCKRNSNGMISRSLSTLNILYLSNIMAEKGVWVLLDSCAILKDHNIEFHCDFVGGWKDISENDFNCRVSELELQHYVCAHGPKYGEEKNSFWQKADIFVFPTFYHNECFPLVLLEAMMNGLPCISTNEAGIPEIIDDGKTGFVVDKKNPNAIVEKIEYFANNRHCLQEFGEAGKAKFQNQYTLEAFEKRFVQCLKNLL